MKRITLFMVTVLLVAVTALAIGQQRGLKLSGIAQQKNLVEKKAPKKASLQRQNDVSKRMEPPKALAKSKGESVAKARKAVGDLLIENQPKGDLVSYVRSGEANYYYWGYIFSTTVSDAANDVVFSSDGKTVYVKNLLTQYTTGTWTKGKIDGNAITFEFPQPAMYYYGSEYDIFLGTYDAENMAFAAKERATLTLDYNPETGDITTPEGSDFATGALQIGLCASDGGWAGYTDWNITMKKQTDKPVAAPEGLETESYALEADGYMGSLVNVGFSGDDVYIQGIYNELPEAWVKGTISGNKVIFKSGQYLGADNYHQYLVAATAEQVWDDYYEEYYTEYTLADGDIEFDYDASTKTLNNGSAFLINAGKNQVSYALAFNKAKMSKFIEVAATPAAPVITGYNYIGYGNHAEYGWFYMTYDMAAKDIDGNFILPEKLSYALFARVGDEEMQLTLPASTYVALSEDMAEIPYGFTEGWDIYQGSMYVYFTGADAYGIQTIYRGAGEERRSEIAWYETGTKQADKVTPTYPELDPNNTGSSVTYTLWDGKTDVNQIGEGNAQTYDVAMKLKDQAVVGTHIDKISFVLMNTQGVSNIKAWLSTNLRVEGGKNTPNLVEIPVENAEAGIITVALDKPYTISEEGVYVGYSFTIDDASIEANQKPVVIIPKTNESGFYLHSSKMYIGWTDLAEEVKASAYIMVDISGSTVKNDAAAAQAQATIYTKAGDAINVNSTIVNHGSNGITSLDIDYILNGSTTSKHFDLEEPVGGYFGNSATVSAELPAVAERGNYDLVVKVVKVNGNVNEDAAAESTSPLVVLNTVPKKRTLLEEYTGTWCGWCPRGFVALEKLAELYPDDYVLISYHNGDPMEIIPSALYPSPVTGFPDSWIDRTVEADPYYGADHAEGNLPIVGDLNLRNKAFGQADIQLTASLDVEKKNVNVKTNVIFPYDNDNAQYAIEYILVADGLTGEGDGWDQSNYFSGNISYADGNLDKFVEADSYVSGLVFNDVAVQVSEIGGIAGSIPTTIKADEAIAHDYNFDLAEALNTDDQPVIQDVNKLRVVAILIDTTTGEVVNANKIDVAAYDPTGIETIQKNGLSTVTERYNAAGQRINAPQKGLNIIKLSNGKTIKMIVK